MADPVAILTLLLEVGKLVASPFKRQYNYLCCLNNNVQALKKEVELLKLQIDRLDEEVRHCNNNGQVVHDDVVKWLREANGIIEEARKIEEGANNVQSGCVGIKSRYVLSKKATKMAQETKEQQDKKKFDGPIAHSAPPLAQLPPLPVRAREFPSRKEIEENVMKALSQRKPGVIGICGMGGLGKTTMAKKLMERVNKDNLFDETVMVVVGQDATDFNIQRDIAEWLKFPLDEESIPARACALRRRLSGGKRIFIVMDDIWKQPEFEDLGIPCEACTILLTSRNVELLKRMDNKVDVEVFTMKLLNDEEALDLFIEKARMDRGDENLFPIAKEFVQECQGLPLTLVIIGSLLKDEKETATWNDMLLKLRSFNIENIQDFDEKVYRSLKLSFDNLNSVDAKKLLLLCSQFPEDFDVKLKDLALYCMSLRLFEDINSNVQQTRDRVQTVIKMLKNRSLLLDGSSKNSVKMHDLVRDVAVVIAKKGESDDKLRSHSVNYCKWIFKKSLNEGRDLSDRFGLLGFERVGPSTVEDLISRNGIAELNSLVLKSIAFESLQQSMRQLMNLRMLHLKNCGLECISIVGELLGLEILRCLGCYKIKELPSDIKKLKHLKVLELKKCPSLEIVSGVISNLVELEELTIRDCFNNWESINATREYVSLKELESLKKLRVLIIDIGDANLVEENVQLDASSLAKYGIRVGEEIDLEDGSFKYEKYLYLKNIPQGVKLGNWIYDQLMSTTECIVCERVEELHELVPFKNLKELVLLSLPNLTHLWKTSNQNASLNHLCKIVIQECDKLKNLFFFHAEDASNCHITFPQLETLSLNWLPSLVTFAEGVESIKFPLLNELEIVDCPKFTRFVTSIGGDPESERQDNDYLFRLFNNQKVSFGSLKKYTIDGNISDKVVCFKTSNDSFKELEDLTVRDFEGIRSLNPSITMEDCINLKQLEIINCREMKKVIANEVFQKNKMLTHLTFSKLNKLKLQYLSNLTALCDGVESVNFPELEIMGINYCPNFINIVSSIGCNQNCDDGHENDTVHLFCCPKNKFGSLKYLTLGGYHNGNIWCHQILPCFFKQLKDLRIHHCGKIQILFSFSIVENLENLDTLGIVSCNKMEKVIGDDERDHDKHILFQSLTRLYLHELPMLGKFCEWNSALELPLLCVLDISKCPQMEYFTSGSLTTPKLEGIEWSFKYLTIEELNKLDGLNGAIIRYRMSFTPIMESSSSANNLEEDHQEINEIEEEEI